MSGFHAAKCPVLSLEKYMSKLNGNNDSFWQRPRDNVTENDNIWYQNSAVGHNTLGKFIKAISIDAGLSQLYTNHCIRASSITAPSPETNKCRFSHEQCKIVSKFYCNSRSDN
jgi:hypothetical protein